VTGEWRKWHNEKLHKLYPSSIIITVIKSQKRIRWAGDMAYSGRRQMHIGFW